MEEHPSKEQGGGDLPAYEGFSYGEGPTLEEAIANAARFTAVRGDEGAWFEISRIQAEVVGHNQWVKGYRVVITPSG